MEHFKQVNDIPKTTSESWKLTMKELSPLDPESGGEKGDWAYTLYFVIKMHDKNSFFTKESLVKYLIKIEEERERTPELKSRIEKTVDNFIERGFLKADDKRKLSLKVEVIGP